MKSVISAHELAFTAMKLHRKTTIKSGIETKWILTIRFLEFCPPNEFYLSTNIAIKSNLIKLKLMVFLLTVLGIVAGPV